MKTATILIAALALCLGLVTGCAKKNSTSSESIQNPEVVARLRSFVAEKNDQTKLLVTSNGDPTPSELESFFVAADKQDWDGTTNNYSRIKRMVGSDARFRKNWWQATLETFGAMEQFTLGDSKYSALYADNIITSIPPGSVYFGGTDPGRFLITAMQRNQAAGDPFFTITQNALADGTYLDYLRSMYGSKLYIPTAEDSQKAFQEYTQDVAKRRQSNQLKSGEDVEVDPASGRVQVSGQVAVMEINGLLVKDIFEKNTNQEFYVEESFPLDWMYPYLEPHGIIFRLNRQPLTELSDEIVQSDHDYWTKTVTPMIGGWLNTGTTVKEVAAFAEKVFGRHDFSGFSGDPHFVQNDYSHKMFSKERSSIAGLYAWRALHTTDKSERKRMNDEADFAFRQAWALCPYSPEAVVRYINLLMSESRFSDALLVAETAAKMPAMKGDDGAQMRGLITQLQSIQRQVKGR